MGNIIQQANDNDRAYDIDANGNLSLLNTLNAKTGVFDNNSWFKQDIRVDGTIDGVDVAALKTSVDNMASAGQGTFTGKTLTALNFTGTSGNFDNLTVSTGTFGAVKTTLLDINGNITNTSGPKYITASTGAGLKLENGSTTSNGYVQVNSDGSISIIPYTGKSLVLGGSMTGAGTINAGAGTFSSLTTSGGLTGAAGTFSGVLTANGGLTTTSLTGTGGTFSGMLTANGGLTLPSSSTLTFGGNMTGAGNINAGAGTFSSLTTSGSLSAGQGTFSGLLTATEGLKIGPSTSVNNWQIKENSGGDLCFFRSGNAFACINNLGNLYAPTATTTPAATTPAATTPAATTPAATTPAATTRAATTPAATTPAATTPAVTTPEATTVVTTNLTTFPIKSNWAVNDKFVMMDSGNNVSRGVITSIVDGTMLNGFQKEIVYSVTDRNNNTTTNQRAYLLVFNGFARSDNSNGVPATSLLRWI